MPTKKKKPVDSNSKEFWNSRVHEFFEDVLSCCLVVEDLLLQEVVEVLEKGIIDREIRKLGEVEFCIPVRSIFSLSCVRLVSQRCLGEELVFFK
ncbi:hypothetical protein NPIL_317271 [Nephila pilipes]|uniref:Uncharacterized protein n=1 Tax=Nephila pilipes TaxID=299642 RepID=A0A8X6KB83_NEPPI|nr:hypothetical protein NPIL_317271 [Nephila pilipes]